MAELIYGEEAYKIIGKCMEVHRQLGAGFLEIVYKDALELEFTRANIPFEREKKYQILYKDVILPHCFYADFVIMNEIVLEIKATAAIASESISQTINYLAVSKCKLGLVVNFGSKSLEYKRVVF